MITRNKNLTEKERDAIYDSTCMKIVKMTNGALEAGLHEDEALHFICFIIFSHHRTTHGTYKSDRFMKWVCDSVRLANNQNY